MAVRVAIANGNFSSTSTWDNGGILGIPTSGDVLIANGFTVLMDQNFTAEALVGGLYIGISAGSQAEITPIMTSNTSPSGICSASVNAATAWNAFDNNGATSWVGTSTTGWVSYQTSTPNIARGYSIYTASNTTTTPRNWTFEGSNDGSTWTILDTRTGIAPSANSWASYIPTTTGSFTYYRLNVTAINGGAAVTIFEFRPSLYYQSTSLSGSFNFNTAGVSVTCTSTSSSLSAGATNLITVTATGGTVTLNLGSSVTAPAISSSQVFNHTGACNFNLSGINFNGAVGVVAYCINKTSTGTITITGNVIGSAIAGTAHSLISTAGNTVVIGNVSAGLGIGIVQSAGNVTVTGNVVGGTSTSVHGISLTGPASQFTINGNVTGGSGASAHGINFGGTLGTVNGNVTGGGGSDARGVNATVGGVNITGNVIGGTGVGIAIAANSSILGNVFGGGQAGVGASANAALTITITGDVYSSSLSPGVTLTQAATQVVNLTGNMYNTLGRMAIWCPNIFISNSATTLWRMDLGGGLTRTLYSADSFPNLPPTSDVRNLIQYGPASGLTGTMVVASPSDIRRNVLTDNTVGTADITAQDILNFINTSSDPLAVRMRTMLTDNSAGQLISEYNFV